MRISLTDFADFVNKRGTPRLTHVRSLKYRGRYHPSRDFWKQLRDELASFHATGTTSKQELDRVLRKVPSSKRNRYAQCVRGYKRFLGRSVPGWFDPERATHVLGGVDIRVNPELGLILGGVRHHVKLHFKAERLSDARAQLLLALMASALDIPEVGSAAVLDVPRGRLYANTKPQPGLDALLQGEAASLRTIWENV